MLGSVLWISGLNPFLPLYFKIIFSPPKTVVRETDEGWIYYYFLYETDWCIIISYAIKITWQRIALIFNDVFFTQIIYLYNIYNHESLNIIPTSYNNFSLSLSVSFYCQWVLNHVFKWFEKKCFKCINIIILLAIPTLMQLYSPFWDHYFMFKTF